MKFKKYVILSAFLITTICRPNALQQQLVLLEVNLKSLRVQMAAQTTVTSTKLFSLMEEVNTKKETILQELLQALKKKTIMVDRYALLKRINNELAPRVQELKALLNRLPANVQSRDDASLAFYILRQLERYSRKKLDTKAVLSKTLYEIDPKEALELHPNFLMFMIFGLKISLPEPFIFYEFDIDPSQPLNTIKAEAEERKRTFSRYEHPDKLPKIADPTLKQKIKEYANEQFQAVTTGLDDISKQENDKIKIIVEMMQAVDAAITSLLAVPATKNAANEVINALETLRSSLYTTVIDARFALYEQQLTALAAEDIEDAISSMKDYLESQDIAQQGPIKNRIQQTIRVFKQSLVNTIEQLKTLPAPQQRTQAPSALARITAYEQAQTANPQIILADDLHTKILQGKQWIETTLGVKEPLQDVARALFEKSKNLNTIFSLLKEVLYSGFIAGAGTKADLDNVVQQTKALIDELTAIEKLAQRAAPDKVPADQKKFMIFLLNRLYRTVYNLRAKLELGYYIHDRTIGASPYLAFSEYDMYLPSAPLPGLSLPKTIGPDASTDQLRNFVIYLTSPLYNPYPVLREESIRDWLSALDDTKINAVMMSEARAARSRMDTGIKQLEKNKGKIDADYNSTQQQAQKLFTVDRPDVAQEIVAMQKAREQAKKHIGQALAKLTTP